MDEEDWEARFEYTSKIPQPSGVGDILSSDSDEPDMNLRISTIDRDLFKSQKSLKPTNANKNTGKKEYTDIDLEKKYDDLRFKLEFIAFKMMAWWPVMDNLAVYGQLINTGLIVYVSISEQVSFYMFFNLLCIAIQFVIGVYQLYKRSNSNIA